MAGARPGKAVWVIPRHKVKNARAHEVHLSEAAVAVIQSLPRVGEGLIFTTTGEAAVSGFSRAKRRLDARDGEGAAQISSSSGRRCWVSEGDRVAPGKPLPIEIPDWTLHDLRRTAATGMARLSFPPHVVDKVLNHMSGTIRGVAAVYNRFEYLDERRAALEAWGRHAENLMVQPNIVELRA